MLKRGMFLALGLIVALSGLLPVSGQTDENAQSPLLTLLAMVPADDMVQNHEAGVSINFVDFQALYLSENIELFRVTGGTEFLMKNVPLPGILGRLVTGPEALRYVFMNWQDMRDTVGFEWIADVNQALEFGAPPTIGTLLRGDFDPATIESALSARDFAHTDVNGIPVWHRLEDAELDMDSINPADPFGGHLGMAARIAIWPDVLANSRIWEITTNIIATAQGDQPALADDDQFRALADTITAPEGLLIQAIFFDGIAVGMMPGDPVGMIVGETGIDPTADYGPLPLYARLVLADRQEGPDQVHLIALVYPDAEVAAAAADEIAERIRTFAPPRNPDFVLADQVGAEVTAYTVDHTPTGLTVAVVEARYPLPEERTDDNGLFISGGRLFKQWINALYQREFFPLWATAE